MVPALLGRGEEAPRGMRPLETRRCLRCQDLQGSKDIIHQDIKSGHRPFPVSFAVGCALWRPRPFLPA
eukprot:1158958-Pelagomonas_calceolata.AAC.11